MVKLGYGLSEHRIVDNKGYTVEKIYHFWAIYKDRTGQALPLLLRGL